MKFFLSLGNRNNSFREFFCA